MRLLRGANSVELDMEQGALQQNAVGNMVPSQRITHLIGIIDHSAVTIFSKAVFRITKNNFTF
jgi:hypothetical protein